MAELTLGRRIAYLRSQAGLTQQDMSVRTGLSIHYLSAIERGRRHVDKASTLAKIAAALGLDDMAELTGPFPWSIQLEESNRLLHPAAREIEALLRRPPLAGADDPAAVDLDELQARVDGLWRTWHEAPDFYTQVAGMLPSLLMDVQTAATAGSGLPDASRRWSLLAQTYHLVRQWLRKCNEAEPATIAADRALHASQMAGDPLLIGMSAWNLVGQHNAAGRYDAALDVAHEGIELTGREASAVSDVDARQAARLRGMQGALYLYASIAAARQDDPDAAWRLHGKGDEISRELGTGFFDTWTTFSQINVRLYEVGLHVELGRPRQATELAERTPVEQMPCVERRTRVLIDVARGFGVRGDHTAAVAVLLQAERNSPEEVTYSLYARELVRDLLRGQRGMMRGDLADLAGRMAVVA